MFSIRGFEGRIWRGLGALPYFRKYFHILMSCY